MTITMSDNVAIFDGTCAVEEAEPLLDWLRLTAAPQVDLSRCDHVHTSILQTLLALRPVIAAASPDALLVQLLGPAQVLPMMRTLNGAVDENDPACG
jgi:hypothetical protein